MDVRDPDAYKMDTLIHSINNDTIYENNPTEDEDFERVLQASLEDSWQHEKRKKNAWDSFQRLLETLKRIGHFDKNIQEVYRLLSNVLYRDAYETGASLSKDQETFILHHTKTIRLCSEDRERLTHALTRLRSVQ